MSSATFLVSQLREVIDEIISSPCYAFNADNHISDSTIIANEMIDTIKKKGVQGFFFKIDFHKAFDYIS
jgi:hypothetical protein